MQVKWGQGLAGTQTQVTCPECVATINFRYRKMHGIWQRNLGCSTNCRGPAENVLGYRQHVKILEILVINGYQITIA